MSKDDLTRHIDDDAMIAAVRQRQILPPDDKDKPRSDNQRAADIRRRGKSYADLAVVFAEQFPMGRELTIAELDEFIWTNTDVRRLTEEEIANKDGDAWMAQCQRRFQFRRKLEASSAHPRMLAKAYAIVPTQEDSYEVRTPLRVMADMNTHKRVEKLVKNRHKQLQYLIQATNWQLSPALHRSAEFLAKEISRFKAQIDLTCAQFDERFLNYRNELKEVLGEKVAHLLDDGDSEGD